MGLLTTDPKKGRTQTPKEVQHIPDNLLQSTFITSDLHLSHTNIIGYTNRPFESTEEMNSILIENWNKAVQPEDDIFFLGDLRYGRNSGSPLEWLDQLNGSITFIRGSHDHDLSGLWKYYWIGIRGVEILLIHNPYHARLLKWEGWTIHGHVHNNRPLFSPAGYPKKVNVSVETTNYTPVSLQEVALVAGL